MSDATRPTLTQLLRDARATRGVIPPVLVEIGGAAAETDLSRWRDYAERPVLVLPSGDRSGAFVTLTIGRGATCDVTIRDASVSSHHATLEIDRLAAEFHLIDEHSRNGTFVDGVRLAPRTRRSIWAGVRVGFGTTLYLFLDPVTLQKLAVLP